MIYLVFLSEDYENMGHLIRGNKLYAIDCSGEEIIGNGLEVSGNKDELEFIVTGEYTAIV